MADIKKTEATVKPVATIKTPVAAETKPETPVVKAEEKKAEVKKAEPKKAAAKKPAAKKAPAKKAATAKKEEPKKAAAKKPAAKKAAPAKKETTAKKATAAKKPATKKAPVKKAAAAKAEVTTTIELQYSYKHVSYDELVQNAKNNFQYEMGGNVDEIKKISIYVKPEEDAAYYVVNDKVQGRIGL